IVLPGTGTNAAVPDPSMMRGRDRFWPVAVRRWGYRWFAVWRGLVAVAALVTIRCPGDRNRCCLCRCTVWIENAQAPRIQLSVPGNGKDHLIRLKRPACIYDRTVHQQLRFRLDHTALQYDRRLPIGMLRQD